MAQDVETARKLVKNWQRTGELLDQIKWDELRAMTEDDAARIFEQLSMHPRDAGMRPERLDGSGLVDQQRIFRRLG